MNILSQQHIVATGSNAVHNTLLNWHNYEQTEYKKQLQKQFSRKLKISQAGLVGTKTYAAVRHKTNMSNYLLLHP